MISECEYTHRDGKLRKKTRYSYLLEITDYCLNLCRIKSILSLRRLSIEMDIPFHKEQLMYFSEYGEIASIKCMKKDE